MARTHKTDRRTCCIPDPGVNLSPKSPRKAKTMVDTLWCVQLLDNAHSTVGKMTRKELFKLHDIAEATGYRIFKSKEVLKHRPVEGAALQA